MLIKRSIRHTRAQKQVRVTINASGDEAKQLATLMVVAEDHAANPGYKALAKEIREAIESIVLSGDPK